MSIVDLMELVQFNINNLSSVLPNNKICDGEIIKQTLKFIIDQVAMMWIYVWEG
ncbi:hypothetical protein [uncultured Methanobrevibacter sp.]|uniref:hypothetical protein n=1 Tax=uncultured Methanobrevibacter sp. TaxID=253161 RepID=UPI0025FA5919|nr:hypothetical protein [uncultured Methanobrevibacter sp.]